ncbi:MAG: polysaccharide biosynthesis protein [Flavobacteriaceae bacterium]|nr:polysaccharide biosynthesis protein [Flavobacteriaceae bacterium]
MDRNNKISKLLTGAYGKFRTFVLEQRYLPRWIVLMIDLLLCLVSFLLTILLLRDTPIRFYKVLSFPEKAMVLLGLQFLCFMVFRSHSGIIRHSTFTDVYRLAVATGCVLFITLLGDSMYFLISGHRLFLTTGLLLYTFFSLTLLFAFRITVKEMYRFLRAAASGKLKKRVIVLGIDDQTIALAQALMEDSVSSYRPVAFLSSKEKRGNFTLVDLPVMYIKNTLDESLLIMATRMELDGVLIVSDLFTVPEKYSIAESCFGLGLEVFNLTLPKQWQKTSDIPLRIAPLQIEDLLERNVIETDIKLIEEDLYGKVILVTGGAGSIGSELVRQIAVLHPKKLIVLDNAESALHEIDVSLKKTYPDLSYFCYLADVTKLGRMEGIFAKYQFDMVYHAAAYKHVPMIERHPREGIRNNTMGTRILAELACKYGCKRFVMISTDKAINPSNVMGATKRAAEMYVQALQRKPGVTTKFITTRFGNVLGSNGSVIPFFRQQIKSGGPVTVTHKDIIRYFMTIQEACQLVLQAGTMGKGGEIFVFDMGKPVRILDLAERMIKLSGLRPYVDIPIEITGLREGEKLYEELLMDGECTLPTYHPKIMVSGVVEYEYAQINQALDELDIMINQVGKKCEIIKKLKQLVPEFLSQNSVFMDLD